MGAPAVHKCNSMGPSARPAILLTYKSLYYELIESVEGPLNSKKVLKHLNPFPTIFRTRQFNFGFAFGPQRTSLVALHMSAYDPKRTLALISV